MIKKTLIVLLFLVVALLFFRGSLFQGRAEIPCNPNRWLPWRLHATPEEAAPPAVNTDCALAYYPRRVFATERMSEGDLPLWDPNTFTGQPFLANFQSALLYPVNVALYALDPMRAMGWFLAIHFFLGGLFAYGLARSFRISRGAAIAAALVFELNPFFLTRLGHPTFVATAAWLPLVLLTGRRLFLVPNGRNAAILALVLALTALAGFPQTGIHIGYALLFFLVCETVTAGAAGTGRRALFFAAAALLAAGAAAFQLLPTAEFLRHSTREPVDTATFLSGTHHPAMLLKMIVPDLFGNPVDENLWSTFFQRGNGLFRQNYVSTLNYFGVLPLVVGIYGIITGRKRFFLAGLFLVPLLVLWGTPLANAAFHFPGFRYSRPDRLILLPLLAISLGFGFGLDRLAGEERKDLRRVVAGLLIFLIAAAAAAIFREQLIASLLRGRALVASGDVLLRHGPLPVTDLTGTALVSALTTILFALLSIALLSTAGRLPRTAFLAGAALIASADLFLFGARFQIELPMDSTFRETAEIEKIRDEVGPHGRIVRFGPGATDLLPPGTASLYGIEDAAGINALNLARYRVLTEQIEPGLYSYRRYRPLHRPESLRSPLLRVIGATVYGVDEGGRLLSMQAAEPLPRVTLHTNWAVLGEKEILTRLGDPRFDPSRLLLLEEEAPPPPVAKGSGTADIQLYEPDRVTVRTESESDSFLLLADAWYPGWEAAVDGVREKIYRADYAFRAVHVPAGKHVIDFRYRPRSFRNGAVLSLAALALIALFLIAGGRKRLI